MFGKFYCKTVPVSIRSYCEERDIKYLHLVIFSEHNNSILNFARNANIKASLQTTQNIRAC